jgi:hypothetical protein
VNRERELLRHNIRGQVQRIWIACSLLRIRGRQGDGETIEEIELATAEILRHTDLMTTTKYPRSAQMADNKHYTIDKIMDVAGVAVPAIPLFFTGLPGWAMGLCALGAYVLGKAGKRGVPLYSSFTREKKDARGQLRDAEEPR